MISTWQKIIYYIIESSSQIFLIYALNNMFEHFVNNIFAIF